MSGSAHKKSLLRTSDFFLLLAVTSGAVIEYLFPTTFPLVSRTVVLIFGSIFLLTAWVIIFFAKRDFKRFSQSSHTGIPTTELVTSGIFRYSRNPMYVGMTLIIVALGLLFNSLWISFSALPAALAMHYLLILPEEKYLAEKFGEAYSNYKQKIRRWI